MSSVSRRSLLTLGAAGLASIPLARIEAFQPQAWKGKRPKNIIFCVADGMALQVVTMANHYQQMTEGKHSFWTELMERPDVATGFQDTRSLSSIVTDSAAAAGAWGSGRRQWNGQINVYPDGTKLRTLYNIAQEAGIKTGLVTTTTMTHATPSGFAVVIDNRDREADIAAQHLTNNVDVLLGGGDKFFNAEKRKDKRDLYKEFAAKGYQVVKDRNSLLGLKSGKILGIFSDSHVPFSVDRMNDVSIQTQVPTLAEMAKTAIENLKGGKNGFILQIEGGKVDHAGHANDIAGQIHDQIDFEDAVKVAIEFAEKDGETLVIITSDHATGGPSLNGAGEEYGDTTKGFASIAGIKASFGPIFDAIGKKPTASMVQDVIREKMTYGLKEAEAQAIADTIQGKSPFGLLELQKAPQSVLALILQNYHKVGYTSLNHTSDHVLVSAFGPGSQYCHGMTNNFEFFNLMLAAKGLKHENPPQMTFEEAAKHMEKNKDAVFAELEPWQTSEDCACHQH
jgi:alkaline phosphatase